MQGNHYLHGIDCLGAGVIVKEWDNHVTFYPGDVVYFSQQYWRAARQIDPPMIPAMMDGEVPGQSNAWRPIPQSEVLGDSGFGASSWLSALKSFGNKSSTPTTPPPAQPPINKQRAGNSTPLYVALGLFVTAVAGLGGYLVLRRRKK
jgi:LPXTG-motif cell wall-anchored protein